MRKMNKTCKFMPRLTYENKNSTSSGAAIHRTHLGHPVNSLAISQAAAGPPCFFQFTERDAGVAVPRATAFKKYCLTGRP